MIHYIDAEKLKERVTRLIASARQNDWPIAEDYLRRVIDIIDSLQQEQPEGLHFTPLNRLIQKIPSENWNDTVNNYAKKLRDCLIKEGYRKDAEVLQGYISYMNGNNVPMATMDEQEQPQVADASKMGQPEVDLENEIKRYTEEKYKETFGNGQGTLDEFDWEDIAVTIEETAVHFVGWKEKAPEYKTISKILALGFMNCLDDNRQKGKMCLSNAECEDITKAVSEQDWKKLERYAKKYTVTSRSGERHTQERRTSK